MPLTEEQLKRKIAYNDQLNKRTLDKLYIQPRKEERFPERIQQAIDAGLASSRQAYIMDAVREKLEKDGF